MFTVFALPIVVTTSHNLTVPSADAEAHVATPGSSFELIDDDDPFRFVGGAKETDETARLCSP